MLHYLEFPEADSAVREIRDLTAAKVEAEANVARCRENLASEQATLKSLLAEPKKSTNNQHLKAAKQACRAGIKAWKLSVVAYQSSVIAYTSEINAVLMRVPEARFDN